MMNPLAFYGERIKEYTHRFERLKKRAALIALARLLSFAAAAVCLYFHFNAGNTLYLFAAVAATALFIWLVKVAISIGEKKELIRQLLFVNQNEVRVLTERNNAFGEGSLMEGAPMHAGDLDIFGPKSLYHLLNRTTTTHGSEALEEALNNPYEEREKIIAQQQALSILAEQPAERQLITAVGLMQAKEKKENVGEITRWIETPNQVITKQWTQILKILQPAAAIAGLLLYLDNSNPIVIGIAVTANWLLTGLFSRYILQQHLLIGRKALVLQQYGTILKSFCEVREGPSTTLTALKDTAKEASEEILALSRLSSFFDQRLNLIVSIFLNSFLLYDLQVMSALERWKRKNRPNFPQWMLAVGEIEKLNSLAAFCFNHPAYIMPVVKEGTPFIQTINIGHPLIASDTQVTNNLTAGITDSLLLVTGSNMSGKSTFLRTVGVNLLMAQCGLPVCATSFGFAPMHILSSIRISDSLQENTSYFMAELKRLREIIDVLASGRPSLVLIDEVLRGTNSDDKTFGSEELIKKLVGYNCLSLFASHDLSLSTLENSHPGKVVNYCFESIITNGELLFDYKLRRGVATNRNASFLMKKMGIID